MVRRIPKWTTTAAGCRKRAGRGNGTDLEEAEVNLRRTAEKDLNALEFQEAFLIKAIQLLQVNNDYWETVKFDELTARNYRHPWKN